jgi:hypothetical protein
MRTPRTVVVPLVAAALALTACSGGSASTPPAPASTSAPAASASGTASTQAGEDAKALAARVVAAMAAKKTAKVSMTAKSAAGETTGSGSVEFGETTHMAMRVVSDATTMNLVLLDKVMYVKASGLPTDKWIKVSAGASDQLSQALAPTLESISSNASVEAMLAGYDGVPVTRGGTSTLDDVAVTEYTYALDSAALAAGIPENLRAQAGAELDGATGTTQMWVDDEGLVRKVLATVDLTSGTTTTTLRYTDWGAPVTIQAPPAAQTIDAAKIG